MYYYLILFLEKYNVCNLIIINIINIVVLLRAILLLFIACLGMRGHTSLLKQTVVHMIEWKSMFLRNLMVPEGYFYGEKCYYAKMLN